MPDVSPLPPPASQPDLGTGILAIDVGNSRSKFGFFAAQGTASDAKTGRGELIATVATRHGEPLPWRQLREQAFSGKGAPISSIIAGVNPSGVQRILDEWPAELSAPRVIRDFRKLGLPVLVDFPEKVGIDRLLNGVAANAWRPADEGAVVVDSGTATTVDRISPAGAFEGGAILPGLELAGRALHEYTALLPLIAPEELVRGEADPAALGKNTQDAIRSGVYWGQIGAIRELVRRLTPVGTRLNLLVTGGAAQLLATHLQDLGHVCVEEHLPLKGLWLVERQHREAGHHFR